MSKQTPQSKTDDQIIPLASLDCLPDLKIGDHADFTTVITPERNEQFLFAERDYDPLYWSGDHPLVHPGGLASLSSLNFRVKPISGWSGLAGRDTVRFFGPAYVGEELLVDWAAAEFFLKRGRQYFVKENVITAVERKVVILRRCVYTTFNQIRER
jgi:hypothetical protein